MRSILPSALDADGVAVLQALRRTRHQELASTQTLTNDDLPTRFGAHRDLAGAGLALPHLEDGRLAVTRDDRFPWQADDLHRGSWFGGRCLLFRLEERDLGAHLGLQVF